MAPVQYQITNPSNPRIPRNTGAEVRSEGTKVQQRYENVHPNLALVLLFVRADVKCGKGVLSSRFPDCRKGQNRPANETQDMRGKSRAIRSTICLQMNVVPRSTMNTNGETEN